MKQRQLAAHMFCITSTCTTRFHCIRPRIQRKKKGTKTYRSAAIIHDWQL